MILKKKQIRRDRATKRKFMEDSDFISSKEKPAYRNESPSNSESDDSPRTSMPNLKRNILPP
jgi:hypothetical protein